MRLITIILMMAFVKCFGQQSVPLDAADWIGAKINVLMKDYTDTAVLPANDGIIIFSKKKLQSEEVKKLWVFIAAGAAGKYFNDHPCSTNYVLYFSDVGDMKARPIRTLALNLSVAKSVQSRIYNEKLGLKEGISEIWNSLEPKTMEMP